MESEEEEEDSEEKNDDETSKFIPWKKGQRKLEIIEEVN